MHGPVFTSLTREEFIDTRGTRAPARGDHHRAQVDSLNKLSRDTLKLQRQTIARMRFVSDSALNILGHMPYDRMKLDTAQFHKVQSNIKAAGAALYLNINHK